MDREGQVAERCAQLNEDIREFRLSMPAAPWATHSYAELGAGVRPEADWEKLRDDLNERLLRIELAVAEAGAKRDPDTASALLDAAEADLTNLTYSALPKLRVAIAEHDAASRKQAELEQRCERLARSRDRWGRLVALRRRFASALRGLFAAAIALCILGLEARPTLYAGAGLLAVALAIALAGALARLRWRARCAEILELDELLRPAPPDQPAESAEAVV